jgi:hypothetical protein
MQIICQKCGISIEKEKPGKYFCTRCKEYTKFFEFKDKSKIEVNNRR